MKIQVENNKSTKGTVIVRRKFVPIKFTIERGNQFLSAGAKLPFFTTSKVVGLLTSTEVDAKCNDQPLPPKYYYGITDTQMEDTSFLEDNAGILLEEDYAPDIEMQGNSSQWWYYVHPVRDRFPTMFASDFIALLDTPTRIDLLIPGQCNPEPYYLWSETFMGFAFITFNESNGPF